MTSVVATSDRIVAEQHASTTAPAQVKEAVGFLLRYAIEENCRAQMVRWEIQMRADGLFMSSHASRFFRLWYKGVCPETVDE